MNEKISWYREVLELEPDSRLFLPLARLLLEEGLTEEAASVLDRGCARHPTYLEARLFRVEVLKVLGRNEESSAELDALVPVLSRNKGFWKAWADNENALGREGTSLAVRMLDLVMNGVGLDMQDIIRRGIESLEMELAGRRQSASDAQSAVRGSELAKEPQAPVVTPVEAPVEAPKEAPAEATVAEKQKPSFVLSVSAKADVGDSPISSGKLSETPNETPADIPAAKPVATPLSPRANADRDKNHWPPRTRSMAEVLAEQEQYRDAASIYAELIENLRPDSSSEEVEALRRRHEELLALAAGRHPEAQGTAAKSEEPAPAEAASGARVEPANEPVLKTAPQQGHDAARALATNEEDGLVNILEELARRMEARIG